MTHICVGNLTIIDPDNGLSPGRRQAIIWTNAWILLIGPLGTNSSEILVGIQTFSFKKMHLKMSSAKWRPFCLGLNVLITSLVRYQATIIVSGLWGNCPDRRGANLYPRLFIKKMTSVMTYGNDYCNYIRKYKYLNETTIDVFRATTSIVSTCTDTKVIINALIKCL